jgi:hypothetical protein
MDTSGATAYIYAKITGKNNFKKVKIIVDNKKSGPILGTNETGERLLRLIPSAGSDQGRL